MSTINYTLAKSILIGVAVAGLLTLIVQAVTTCTAVDAIINLQPNQEVGMLYEKAECAKRTDKCSIAYTAKWHENFEKKAIGHTKGAVWFFGERHDYR